MLEVNGDVGATDPLEGVDLNAVSQTSQAHQTREPAIEDPLKGVDLHTATSSADPLAGVDLAEAASDKYQNKVEAYNDQTDKIVDHVEKRGDDFLSNPNGAAAQNFNNNIKGILDTESGIKDTINDYVVQPIVSIFSAPAQMLGGLFSRGDNAAKEGQALRDPIQGWLNPPELEAIRAHDEATGENKLVRMWHEVAPPLTVSQATSKATDPAINAATEWVAESVQPAQKKLETFLSDKANQNLDNPKTKMALNAAKFVVEATPDVIAAAGTVAKFGLNLGIDITTDPALQFVIASELSNGSDKIGYMLNKDGTMSAYAKGLAMATEEGKAGAIVYKPMFPYNQITDPKIVVKGQSFMDFVQTQQVKQAAATPDFIRGLLRGTADTVFDAHLNAAKYQEYADAAHAEGIRQNFNNGVKLTSREAEVLNAMAEFPEQRRYQAFLKGKGITLDAAEEERLQNIKNQLLDLQKQAVEKHIAAGGRISEFQGADYQSPEAKNVLHDFKAKGIPLVESEGQDFTLSDERGFGRVMKDDAVKLKKQYQMQFEQNASVGGMKINPDTNMARDKLSTEAASREFALQYGLENPYVLDPIEVTTRKIEEINKSTRDLKFLNSIKDRGFTAEEWAMNKSNALAEIEAARRGIELPIYKNAVKTFRELNELDPVQYNEAFLDRHLNELGGDPYAVSRETEYRANMDLKKLRPMSAEVWDRKELVEGVEDPTFKKLLYDRGVVNQVDSMYAAQNKSKLVAGYDWLNKQLAASMVSSPLRFLREFTSNFTQAAMQGIGPNDFLREMKVFMSGGDELTNIISKTSNVFDTRSAITSEMIDNSESYKPLGSFFETIKSLAEQGRLKQDVSFFQKAKNGLAEIGNKLNFLDPRPASNPMLVALRNKANGSVDFFKSALARKYISEGYTMEEAVTNANTNMMAFDRSTPQLQALKRVNPFAQFMIRRTETFASMLLERPGLINVVGPEGYLMNHIQKEQGWSPDQVAVLKKLSPGFMFDPIVGTLLTGVDSYQKQAPGINRLINKTIGAVASMSPEMKDVLDKTQVLYWQAYTPSHEIGMMFNNKSAGSALGPVMKMGLIMMGYDPFTDKPIPYQGTDPGMMEKTMQMLDQVSPNQFPLLKNTVIQPLMDKLMPQYMDRIRNYGIDPNKMRIIEQFLGEGLSAPENFVKQFSKVVTGGMGQMTNADLSYMFMQTSLLKQVNTDIDNAYQLIINKGQKSQIDIIKKTVAERRRQLTINARVFDSMKALIERRGGDLDAPPIGDETPPETVNPPVDSSEETDEESSNQSPSDRSPASQKKVQQEPMTNVRMVDNGPDAKRAMFLQKGKEANFPGFNPADKQRLAYLSDMLSNPITVANVEQVEAELKRNDGKVLERYAKSIGVKDADYKKFQQNILLKVERAKADAESLDRVGSKQPFAGST